MPLKIVSAVEPIVVETLVVTIFAPPGTGKSTLGFTAASPLLIDADQGAYRSAFRKDTAETKTWSDIASITKADIANYRTLVLDTAGRTLDLLSADIIEKNPKMGKGGALTLQGYGELKSRFTAYLKLMRSFGLDIVLIAHSDEKQQGDEIIERIDMQGGSKNEVYKVSDAMARLGIVGGKRVLSFSPTETKFGKDPASLGVVEVPDAGAQPEFLGQLIKQIKDKLNAGSAVHVAAAERAAKWVMALDVCEDADDFNGIRAEAQNDLEKRQLVQAAKRKGFAFDKAVDSFVSTEGALAQ